jgi:hypothetical protein
LGDSGNSTFWFVTHSQFGTFLSVRYRSKEGGEIFRFSP